MLPQDVPPHREQALGAAAYCAQAHEAPSRRVDPVVEPPVRPKKQVQTVSWCLDQTPIPPQLLWEPRMHPLVSLPVLRWLVLRWLILRWLVSAE